MIVETYVDQVIPIGTGISVLTGGSLVLVQDHVLLNYPEHLAKARVSKKVTDGLYEVLPDVEKDVAERRPRYTLKRPDLYSIVPNIDPRTFVGATTKEIGTPELQKLLDNIRKSTGKNESLLLYIIRKTEDKGLGCVLTVFSGSTDESVDLVADPV